MPTSATDRPLRHLKLGSGVGLALAMCLLAAGIDVTVFSDAEFADAVTWFRFVSATAFLLASIGVPACLLVWAISLRWWRDGGRNAVATASVLVMATLVPLGLHALRLLQAGLPDGIDPLSPLGVGASGALGLVLLLAGAGAVALLIRLGLGSLLLRRCTGIAVVGWTGLAAGVLSTTIAAPDREADPRPNVLLISVDSVRADSFWQYVDAGGSDALRSFVKSGRRFRRSYTTFSHSLPSHASMFTGLYPPEHGAISQSTTTGAVGSALADDVPLLAARFRDAGYETFGVVSNDWLAAPYGLEAGFETYLLHGRAQALAYFDWSLLESVSVAGFYKAWIENALIRRGHWNSRIILSWLAGRDRSRPFFAFLHYIEMHVPHDSHGHSRPASEQAPFSDLDGEQLGAMFDAGEIPDDRMPAALRRIRELERAQLSVVETFFVPVLEALMADDRLANTLVFLTSDHGDNLYEKAGSYGHSHAYETCGRIPLVVRGPRVAPGDDERLASLVDIAPTAYRFADVPVPDGLSGLDLLGNPPRSAASGDWIYLQGMDTTRAASWARAVVWADGRKFLRDAEREQVFDLSRDPRERHDLLPADPRLAATLRERFDGILAGMNVAETAAPIPVGELPEKTREGLRALGYIE